MDELFGEAIRNTEGAHPSLNLLADFLDPWPEGAPEAQRKLYARVLRCARRMDRAAAQSRLELAAAREAFTAAPGVAFTDLIERQHTKPPPPPQAE
jgi:hypothetical protein